jgi:hypothetical protein
MRYFLLEIPAKTYPTTDPVDDQGRFVEVAGTPNPWELNQAFVTVPYFSDEKDVDSADALPELLAAGLDWMISGRVLTVMRNASMAPEVGFLPTVVRNRKGDGLATYHLIYSRGFYSVLDEDRSGATLFEDGAIDNIKRWVLNREKIPQWDLFLAHDRGWIASERLRALIAPLRVRGLNFRKITCVN